MDLRVLIVSRGVNDHRAGLSKGWPWPGLLILINKKLIAHPVLRRAAGISIQPSGFSRQGCRVYLWPFVERGKPYEWRVRETVPEVYVVSGPVLHRWWVAARTRASRDAGWRWVVGSVRGENPKHPPTDILWALPLPWRNLCIRYDVWAGLALFPDACDIVLEWLGVESWQPRPSSSGGGDTLALSKIAVFGVNLAVVVFDEDLTAAV